jgi:iron complex outermembrane receptor protein
MVKLYRADRAGAAAARPSATAIFTGASILALAAGAAPAAAAEAAAGGGPQLEEVVVTARRVTENVQTIPVSVSSVSLKQIQDQNISRLENIQKFTPNLTVIANGPSSVAPMLFMRGIGSPSVALYSEPPIALYIDGVYTPRPTSAAFDIPDMGGIQVLRGPQGTLFGRNTTGGAILITTQTPRHDFGGTAQVAYGSDNDWTDSVVLHSGDLDDKTKLRFKLVGQTHDRNGWVEFPGFNKSQWGGALHSRSISLTGDMDLTDKLTAEAAVGYSKLKSAVGFQTLAASAGAIAYFGQSPTYGGPPFLIGQQPLDLAYRDPRQISNEAEIKNTSARLNLTYDAGEALVLKSITAYSKIDENLTGQLGGSSVLGKINVLGATVISPIITHLTPAEPGNQNQFSEEFNAAGRLFSDFSYVAGLYYFQEHADETVRTLQISAPTTAASVVTVTDRSVTYAERTKSYAGYGQLSYKPHQFDGKLEISAGLRWTKDKKNVESETFATSSATGLTTVTGTVIATGLPGASTTAGAIRASTDRASWSNTGWSASISYQLTPTIYTFARASSAFRAGGFNAISTNAPSYAPEKAISYEGGVKTEWLDQHLRVNLVGFYTDYKDLQITQFIGPPRNTTFITNAGRSHYSGYELEAQAILGHGFSADLNYGYVFPKYKEYLIGALPLPASCAAAPTDPSCFQNVAGVARFPFVSKTSIHAGAQWVSPATAFGVVTLRADYSYKSSFLFGALDLLSPNNTKVRSGIDRNLSARIILSEIPIGGDKVHLKVQAFGDNLTDNRFIVEAVDFSTTMNGIFNRPRNYGVIVTADF